MKIIYKYRLSIVDEFAFYLPERWLFLCVQLQNGDPYLWAIVNPESERKKYTFYCYGTGNEITEDLNELVYVGTIQFNGYVWHYFYKP